MSDLVRKLSDATTSGVYRLTRDPLAIEQAARAARLAVYRIDLSRAHDKGAFMSQVAQALRFPSYFGNNLDALHDCLTDLDWLQEGDEPLAGFVLVFESAAAFAAGHSHDLEDCLAVMRSAAEHWRGTGKPFWVFLHSLGEWKSSLPAWPGRE
jgi:RNAse (barnase) inhibitor barstar